MLVRNTMDSRFRGNDAIFERASRKDQVQTATGKIQMVCNLAISENLNHLPFELFFCSGRRPLTRRAPADESAGARHPLPSERADRSLYPPGPSFERY
ncbi:hypothetical protein SBA2_450133 [Acidobacteriia bacterium SbA2]|nr:hypothetical protein SBA2_450133 [Acidobacteriia bacterium SbA2]